MKRHGAFPFTGIIVCGLLLSFLLVLITDGTRLLIPKKSTQMLVEILLEDMDVAVSEALRSETRFSMDGSPLCHAHSVGETEALVRLMHSTDGKILALPSRRSFTARLTLLLEGRQTEDGFLAFGTRRILCGAQVRIDGQRMTAKGRILSLKPAAGE